MSTFYALQIDRDYIEEDPPILKVGDVPLGMAFMTNGDIFIRIKTSSHNAFRLEGASLEFVDPDYNVAAVRATLSWKPI